MSISKVKKCFYKLLSLTLIFSLFITSLPVQLFANQKTAIEFEAEINSKDTEDKKTPKTIEQEIVFPDDLDQPKPMDEQTITEPNRIFMSHVINMPDFDDIPPYTPEETIDYSNETYFNKESSTITVIDEVYGSFSHESIIDMELIYEEESKSVINEVYKKYPIKNNSSLYSARFSPEAESDLLLFSHGKATISLGPIKPNPVKAKIKKNQITYENLYPHTDFQYTVEKDYFKEDIIVQKYTGQNQFDFQMSVSEAVYEALPNGTINFLDSESKTPLFYMAKPIAIDKNGERCDLISIDLSTEGFMKLSIDPKWLEEATYPITIDPTIYLASQTPNGAGIRSYWNYNGFGLGGGWNASVNTYNLNLVIRKTLFSIPGRGIPIGETITYNSTDTRTSPLGIGWHLGSNTSVIEYEDGSVIYSDAGGATYKFTPDGSGGYIAAKGIYLTLKKFAQGNFNITDRNKSVFTFANNKPVKFVDRNNNTTTLNYDTNGRLNQLTDPSGRSITYSYNSNGQLASVTDPAGRAYQFAYQGDCLTSITDPQNNTVFLGYNPSCYLNSFKDPLNRITSFDYSIAGKLSLYKDARSNSSLVYQHTFNQSTQNNQTVTTVTNPANRVSTYYHDLTTGNLLKYQNPLGKIWQYSWNYNELMSEQNERGAKNYWYDGKGNIHTEITTVDSNWNNNIEKRMTYNDYNQILKVIVDNQLKKSYEYSAKGEMLSSSDPNRKESNGMLFDQYGNVLESSPGVSSSYNLLRNGSMEVPGSSGNLLAHWTRETGGSATATMEGFNAYGNSALKLSSSTNTTVDFYQFTSDVKYGDKLTLRVNLKLDNVTTPSTNGGAYIKIDYGDYWETIYFTGSGIVPVVLTSRAAKDYFVKVYIGLNNAKGTVWFDGVQLENWGNSVYGYTLSAFNSVEDSSFEIRQGDWNYSGPTASITADEAWGGRSSLKLAPTGSGTYSFYQDVPVRGGEPLTFSGMTKTNNVSGNGAYYKIDYYDSANNLIPGSSIQFQGQRTGRDLPGWLMYLHKLKKPELQVF